MDLTGLATYEVMKKWTDRLFNVYSQSVAPGFHKVSQAQLLRADRQAFVRLGHWLVEAGHWTWEGVGSLHCTTGE